MEIIRRRHLPHWDVDGSPYFVTTCLKGSIPARGQLDISAYKAGLSKQVRPSTVTEAEWKVRHWKLTFSRTDHWLDTEPTVKHLADERLANEVVNAFFHFAGVRYDLLAFVVMPSHIHWVFRPLARWVATLGESVRERSPRERIIQSINRHTSYECNKIMRSQGNFWQHESYDHWVRDAEELERIMNYIENNPVAAGFVPAPIEWPHSSCRWRELLGLNLGEPMIRPAKRAD